MVFSKRNVTQQQQTLVNVAEVANLWDLLVADYQTLEQLKINQNFAHDPDLLLLMANTAKDLEGKIKMY